jgi:hypothetical protein
MLETGHLVIILKDAIPWAWNFLRGLKIDKIVFTFVCI